LDSDGLLDQLNQFFIENRNYDTDFYRAKQHMSVHIGDFILENTLQHPDCINVAILMPVFNTKAEFLS
jgi:hypothetical protein